MISNEIMKEVLTDDSEGGGKADEATGVFVAPIFMRRGWRSPLLVRCHL